MVTFGIPATGGWQAHKDNIAVHPTCIVAPCASVFFTVPPAGPGINLSIGQDSHVYSMFNFLRADARISVGERCQLGMVNFVCSLDITVRDDVLMAWGINILDSNHHSLYWEERKDDVRVYREDYIASGGRAIGASVDWSIVARKPTVIESKVWIGFNAIILKGVTIGEGAVIAPGSVVTKDVEPWTLGGGNPFRPIRSLPRSRPEELRPAGQAGQDGGRK